MTYELHLKAETIAELAYQVKACHIELSNINVGDKTTEPLHHVAIQNHIAAASTSPIMKDGDIFTLPDEPKPYKAEEVKLDPSANTLDAEGLPWDERIHSSNRKMTAKGVWTRRKNVDDAVFNSVVAELRGESQTSITSAFANELPQPAPQPEPVPVPAFLQRETQTPTINDLFIKLQQLSKEGVFTAQYNTDLIGALVQQFQVQVNSINDIAARPDMIAAAFQYIASKGN